MAAHFVFMNNLKSAVRMDEPITKGPVPRWQKKANVLTDTSNSSQNTSKGNISKTSKEHNESNVGTKKTPSKTPKKSPGSKSNPNTPYKPKTPTLGDRFIVSRSATDFEAAHYQISKKQENVENTEDVDQIVKDKCQVMSETLCSNLNKTKILAFQTKAPAPPEGYQNAMKVVYSQTKTPMSTKSSRYIPHAPERILDAPDIVDDYYLNLVDWSPHNVLAVSLGNSVYLWNAETGGIEQLLELEGADYVCSVAWIQEGNLLAVGTSLGDVQIWDAEEVKRVRTMEGHSARVSSLSWNSYILSSGSRSGQIIHHDVRQRDHHVSTLSAHTHEVCGLKWSLDGQYLASGGNDNLLNIWSGFPGSSFQTRPIYTFSNHQAAVKGLAWSPWNHNILASGGGTADRRIRFWNCSLGSCVNEIDTKSQVCSLLWSNTYKELISGHGFANNQLIIWKYPSLQKVAELTGHTARVLHLALSPDGTTVLSAGADETLRLWRCFVSDKKKSAANEKKAKTSLILTGYRM